MDQFDPRSAEYQRIHTALQDVFNFIGDDPLREGLKETPKRMIKSWSELFSGYSMKREDVLTTTFSEHGDYDQVVMLRNIDFFTFCEHHFLPFQGRATVGYIPSGGVVGLSKLARLVDMHAKRLQIQEKMTNDIANDLDEVLKPLGVMVVIEAHHSCMGCRGVKKPRGIMTTSAVRGVFKTDMGARQEFLQLMNREEL